MANILVIDDDKDDLKLVKSILIKAKHKVQTIECKKNCVAKVIQTTAKGCPCDLILINVAMPEISAYDLMRIIKRKTVHCVKLIFISLIPKKDIEMNGADGFVQKPFSKETLLKEISRVLKIKPKRA